MRYIPKPEGKDLGPDGEDSPACFSPETTGIFRQYSWLSQFSFLSEVGEATEAVILLKFPSYAGQLGPH